MARRTPFPNMVCGVCETSFVPSYGQHYDRKEGRIHCCSKECERKARQTKAAKLPLDLTLLCGECGVSFSPTKSQRDKYICRPNSKQFCNRDCLASASSKRVKQLADDGRMPVWGSPAQLEVARKLGKYSLANKKFGREHPNWRNGLSTTEMLEVRRLRVNIKRYIKEGANQ
jgi:hypothetical protein